MRGINSVSHLVLLLATAAVSAVDAPDPVRVPSAPAVVPPLPAPGAPLDLVGDLVYAVDSDVDFLIFASPDGLVKITREDGPMKYRARFVGGDGRVQTKHFKGKSLAFVEATGKGDCELIIVPAGTKDETKAIRQKLRVDAGTGPIPPPIIPPTPANPLTAAFQAAFDLEPARVADKAGVVWAKADYAAKLAALYAKAATVTVTDPTVKTYGDLFSDLKAAATFPGDAMPRLRKAVSDYLDAKLKPTELKAIDRDACKAAFEAAAAALQGVH